MLGFDGEYPAVHPKAKCWRFLVKNSKKSAVKHSIEKPVLLNFMNLPPTFCPRLLILIVLGLTQCFLHKQQFLRKQYDDHCVISACIRTYSDPLILTPLSLRIQSECRKMRTRITPNTGTFYAVDIFFIGVLRTL